MTAKLIKENCCYVPYDYGQECNGFKTKQWELPDGRTVKVDAEGFEAGEGLFQPYVADQ